jgi:chromosome partitioning protein
VGQTIACTNQKGGVGKTTTVVNLATYLALLGDRVLVIDLDPQGNATSGFGVDRTAVAGSAYDALIDQRPLADLHVATPVEGLRLVPSSISLAGAEVELAGVMGRERRLARLTATEHDGWDWILVDCPPSLGLLTVNAMTGSDAVLVPIQCEYYALEGLAQLIATINLVRDHLNPNLEISGVLLTMFDGRTNLSAEVAAEVRRHLRDRVFETVVPRSVRLSEAPSHGLPIALYRPESKGADAYRSLAFELRARRRAAVQEIGSVREPIATDAPAPGITTPAQALPAVLRDAASPGAPVVSPTTTVGAARAGDADRVPHGIAGTGA